jgi:hypothetical protein
VRPSPRIIIDAMSDLPQRRSPTSPRGFESEPSDEWREDYGRGGPVRSNEPERDWFFESNAAPARNDDREVAARAAKALRDKEPTSIKQPPSHRGRGPKGYRPRDERLYEVICERLTEHRAIDASELSVAVDQGIVTVSGTVPNRAMKRAVEEVIAEVLGVVHIQNDVKAGGSSAER